MTTPAPHFEFHSPRESARPAAVVAAGARRQRGFTVVELMAVVVIVGVLAAIALPMYTGYVQRGKASEVTGVLGGGRVNLEQWFLDNKTYVGGPCPGNTKSFTIACTLAASTYTITATGGTEMSGFVYTVNQANARTTAGPFGSASCWIFKKGDTC